MICPRCGTPSEKETDVYCLTCGKKMQEETAFDEEFEGEFLYDEQLERKRKRALEIKTEKRRRLLLAIVFPSAALLLVLCIVLALLPAEKGTDRPEQSPASSAQTVQTPSAADHMAQATALVERTLAAGNVDSDPDALLDCVHPLFREGAHQVLLEAYGCSTHDELREAMRAPEGTSITAYRDLRLVTLTPLDETQRAQVSADLFARYGVPLPPEVTLYSAEVTCTVLRGESAFPQSFTVLCGAENDVFYSFDL